MSIRTETIGTKRLVVKIRSSSLTDWKGYLDPACIETFVAELASLQARDKRLVLVISGAIAVVLGPLELPAQPKDPETQRATAAVGQGILIRRYVETFVVHYQMVAQALLTVSDLQDGRNYRDVLNAISWLFRLGMTLVINESDTVVIGEIRFSDNNRLAVLTAHLVRVDALVTLSDMDGLYVVHPVGPGVRSISRVHDFAELMADTSRVGSRVGADGMRTKTGAARIATSDGVSMVLAHADQPLVTPEGEEVGILFETVG